MAVWKDPVCGGEIMRYGHLEKAEIRLRTLSPVFIGSGESLTKKEYIFEDESGTIHVPDLARFTAFLSKRGLIAAFEEFVTHPHKNDLRAFLSEHKVGKKDYHSFVRYSVDAGEVAASERFRGLLLFVKGPDGYPYIPGSSVKGAIRTAIAARLVQAGNYERNVADIDRAIDDFRGRRRYLSYQTDALERKLFCRLNYTDPRNTDRIRWDNLVNDFMRGIQISDSSPIGFENLTVCGKYDRKPDGFVNLLPIFRECLAPGTETVFSMTMDLPVLAKAGIDVKFIKDALHSFADMQYEYFDRHFASLLEDADTAAKEGVDIVIGGGAGYATKTIMYPLVRPHQRALRMVGRMMTKQFSRHQHEKDATLFKVSPHMLKTTMYKGKYYQMGKCEVIFS
ncbi:MAG: type III-A CRISPR-associated RAMP protein Csm5 [Clostridia bacterium]|jgi:CRISPR-associated protein Csm5